ncbi:unnamed protein product [Urochloa humidicola]
MCRAVEDLHRAVYLSAGTARRNKKNSGRAMEEFRPEVPLLVRAPPPHRRASTHAGRSGKGRQEQGALCPLTMACCAVLPRSAPLTP